MELHHNGRGDRRQGVGALAGGLVCIVVGGCLGLVVGGPGWAGAAIAWLFAAFLLIAGVVLLVNSIIPIRIRLDASMLDVRSQGHRFTGSWDQVLAINIERIPSAGDPPTSREVLVLWVADGVPMKHRGTFPAADTDRKGHVLVALEDVRETREEVVAALQRYAGDKYRSMSTA